MKMQEMTTFWKVFTALSVSYLATAWYAQNVDALYLYFLASEIFHAIAHSFVFFLGRNYVQRVAISENTPYFIWDLLSGACGLLVVPSPMWFLILIHTVFHFLHVYYWDKSTVCRDLITWSSKDWNRKSYALDWYHFLFIWGATIYDICIHLLNATYTNQYLLHKI